MWYIYCCLTASPQQNVSSDVEHNFAHSSRPFRKLLKESMHGVITWLTSALAASLLPSAKDPHPTWLSRKPFRGTVPCSAYAGSSSCRAPPTQPLLSFSLSGMLHVRLFALCTDWPESDPSLNQTGAWWGREGRGGLHVTPWSLRLWAPWGVEMRLFISVTQLPAHLPAG